MSDVRVKTTAVIREVLNERTYSATLRNGKRIIAYVLSQDGLPPMSTGETCHVLLSLGDFNEGRIVPADMGRVRVRHPIIECL